MLPPAKDSDPEISRRNFMKYGGAAAVASSAALAGCSGDGGSNGTTQSTGTTSGGSGGLEDGERPLKGAGLAPFQQDQVASKYESVTGISLEWTNVPLPSLQSKLIGGGLAESTDMVSTDQTQMPTLYEQDVVQSVPVSELDKWNEDDISPLLTKPTETVGYLEEQADRIADIIWEDNETKENLSFAPIQVGFDGVQSNPKFVDEGSITKWSALFDDQYKGEALFDAVSSIGGLEALSHLVDNDIVDGTIGDLNNPTKEQIDGIVDFCVKEKKAGQFRTTFTSLGTAINVMANEEAVVGDMWQAGVFAVRGQGTPIEQGDLGTESQLQGYRNFLGSTMPTNPGASDRNNLDEVYEYFDKIIYGAWFPGFFKRQLAFNAANYPNRDLVRGGSDESGEGMGPEFYDWAFDGKATYEAVEDPYLFQPSEYEWSMEEGEPSSDGKVYERGSMEDRISRIGFSQVFPDNGVYLQEEWQAFNNA